MASALYYPSHNSSINTITRVPQLVLVVAVVVVVVVVRVVVLQLLLLPPLVELHW